MKTKLYPHTIACLTIILLLLSTSSRADVNLGLFLSKQTHILDESSPILSITAQNSGAAEVQDVHIGVISPDGRILEFPDWNTALQPWLPAFTIPAKLDLPNTAIINNLDSVPGGLTPGIWQVFFALTNKGTLEINQLQLVELNVIDGSGTLNGSSLGTVTINRTQSTTGTSVTAGAAFFEANTSFTNLASEFQGQTPAIDQCVFNEIKIDLVTIPDFEITSLNAGLLSVAGGGKKIPLDKQTSSSFIAYSASPSLAFFDNAANFTFNGSGGSGVGDFSVTIPSINSLDLISPALGSSLSINSGQNLVLTWTNNNKGSGEVVAVLSGIDINLSNPTASRIYSINCRFIDDGNGIIPSSLLRQLEQALPADSGFDIPGGLPIDFPEIPGIGSTISLSLNRARYQFFTTSAPTLNNGIATVSSGVSLNATFQ